jgi:hypothetical protein
MSVSVSGSAVLAGTASLKGPSSKFHIFPKKSDSQPDPVKALAVELTDLFHTLGSTAIKASTPETLYVQLTKMFSTGGDQIRAIIENSKLCENARDCEEFEKLSKDVIKILKDTVRMAFWQEVQHQFTLILVKATPEKASHKQEDLTQARGALKEFFEVKHHYIHSILPTLLGSLLILSSDPQAKDLTSSINNLAAALGEIKTIEEEGSSLIEQGKNVIEENPEFDPQKLIKWVRPLVERDVHPRMTACILTFFKCREDFLQTCKRINFTSLDTRNLFKDSIDPHLSKFHQKAVHTEMQLKTLMDSLPDTPLLETLKETYSQFKELSFAMGFASKLYEKISQPDPVEGSHTHLITLRETLKLIYRFTKSNKEKSALPILIATHLNNYFYGTKGKCSETYIEEKSLQLLSLCKNWKPHAKEWLVQQLVQFVYPTIFSPKEIPSLEVSVFMPPTAVPEEVVETITPQDEVLMQSMIATLAELPPQSIVQVNRCTPSPQPQSPDDFIIDLFSHPYDSFSEIYGKLEHRFSSPNMLDEEQRHLLFEFLKAEVEKNVIEKVKGGDEGTPEEAKKRAAAKFRIIAAKGIATTYCYHPTDEVYNQNVLDTTSAWISELQGASPS